jgi:hypothetical protein
MNYTLKLCLALLLAMSSQSFFAQQSALDQKTQEIELRKSENEARRFLKSIIKDLTRRFLS